MDSQYPHIGERILSRIKALHLTQVELCTLTGLSTTAMSAYCKEKRTPETTALYRISKALGVSMEWILTGENQTNEDSTNEDVLVTIPPCDGSPLSEDEADIVAMYRLLPSLQQEELFDLTYFKYKRHVEQKKESIYWTYHDGSGDEKSGPAEGREPRGGTA